jgi:L-ascorbate metabolism protein UlaG (beta-lactamase superfamily)
MTAMGLLALTATGAAGEGARDEFTAPNGKTVAFTCIKHGSLRIEYDGLEIQVDPVGKGVAPETDYGTFPKADLILVTHEHFDHFDREAIGALRKEGTEAFANAAVRDQLGWGTALANGDRVRWRGDAEIAAVPAHNTTPGREKFHPKGRDNGYVLTLGGFRVYVAGDTEAVPELGGVDAAFLPCNQPYTMTPEQAAEAARKVGAKVLFPYHFGETRVERVAELLAGSGIDVRIRDYR